MTMPLPDPCNLRRLTATLCAAGITFGTAGNSLVVLDGDIDAAAQILANHDPALTRAQLLAELGPAASFALADVQLNGTAAQQSSKDIFAKLQAAPEQ